MANWFQKVYRKIRLKRMYKRMYEKIRPKQTSIEDTPGVFARAFETVSSEWADLLRELSKTVRPKEISFGKYLNKMIVESDMSVEDISNEAEIDRSYLYKILRNEKKPTKYIIISIGLAMELSYEEIKELLNKAGYHMDPEDFNADYIIHHCLLNLENPTVTKINHVLESEGFPDLKNLKHLR